MYNSFKFILLLFILLTTEVVFAEDLTFENNQLEIVDYSSDSIIRHYVLSPSSQINKISFMDFYLKNLKNLQWSETDTKLLKSLWKHFLGGSEENFILDQNKNPSLSQFDNSKIEIFLSIANRLSHSDGVENQINGIANELKDKAFKAFEKELLANNAYYLSEDDYRDFIRAYEIATNVKISDDIKNGIAGILPLYDIVVFNEDKFNDECEKSNRNGTNGQFYELISNNQSDFLTKDLIKDWLKVAIIYGHEYGHLFYKYGSDKDNAEKIADEAFLAKLAMYDFNLKDKNGEYIGLIRDTLAPIIAEMSKSMNPEKISNSDIQRFIKEKNDKISILNNVINNETSKKNKIPNQGLAAAVQVSPAVTSHPGAQVIAAHVSNFKKYNTDASMDAYLTDVNRYIYTGKFCSETGSRDHTDFEKKWGPARFGGWWKLGYVNGKWVLLMDDKSSKLQGDGKRFRDVNPVATSMKAMLSYFNIEEVWFVDRVDNIQSEIQLKMLADQKSSASCTKVSVSSQKTENISQDIEEVKLSAEINKFMVSKFGKFIKIAELSFYMYSGNVSPKPSANKIFVNRNEFERISAIDNKDIKKIYLALLVAGQTKNESCIDVIRTIRSDASLGKTFDLLQKALKGASKDLRRVEEVKINKVVNTLKNNELNIPYENILSKSQLIEARLKDLGITLDLQSKFKEVFSRSTIHIAEMEGGRGANETNASAEKYDVYLNTLYNFTSIEEHTLFHEMIEIIMKNTPGYQDVAHTIAFILETDFYKESIRNKLNSYDSTLLNEIILETQNELNDIESIPALKNNSLLMNQKKIKALIIAVEASNILQTRGAVFNAGIMENLKGLMDIENQKLSQSSSALRSQPLYYDLFLGFDESNRVNPIATNEVINSAA